MENYFERKMNETLEKIKLKKEKGELPLPEPVNILPPLPIIEQSKYKDVSSYQVKNVGGHWEVYKDGKFYCSATTKAEAYKEIWD